MDVGKQIARVAGFELGTLFRSKRALAIILLYVLVTLGIAALLTWLSMKFGPQLRSLQLAANLHAHAGANAAAHVKNIIPMLVRENDTVTLNHLMNQPIVIIGYFLFVLLFIPYLPAMMSFDIVNADIRSRFMRFQLLRASRGTLLAGKIIAHWVLFLIVIGIANMVLFGYAWAKIVGFPLVQSFTLLFEYWFITAIMGFCYISLVALISSLIDQGILALIAILIVVHGLGLLAFNSSAIHFLSPSWYKFGLLSADIMVVGLHSLIFLGFGVVFMAAAWFRLQTRDT